MYIRLSIKEKIIKSTKVNDICEVFGDKLKNSFEYYNLTDISYLYKYPVDIIVTTEEIQELMNLNYKVLFYENIIEIS